MNFPQRWNKCRDIQNTFFIWFSGSKMRSFSGFIVFSLMDFANIFAYAQFWAARIAAIKTEIIIVCTSIEITSMNYNEQTTSGTRILFAFPNYHNNKADIGISLEVYRYIQGCMAEDNIILYSVVDAGDFGERTCFSPIFPRLYCKIRRLS